MILDDFLWNHAVAVVLLVSLCLFLLLCNVCFLKCCCGHWFFVDISLPCSAVLVFAMLFSSFSTIVFWLNFVSIFDWINNASKKATTNGIEEHSKLENPSLLGHDQGDEAGGH